MAQSIEEARERLAALQRELGTLGEDLERLGYGKISKDVQQIAYLLRMAELATHGRPDAERWAPRRSGEGADQ